jgi:hypothetical protein
MKAANIKISNNYLSFDGHPNDAIRFVNEIRETFDKSGSDMGKTLNDFIFGIEVALQNAGYLDEDFNEVNPTTCTHDPKRRSLLRSRRGVSPERLEPRVRRPP